MKKRRTGWRVPLFFVRALVGVRDMLGGKEEKKPKPRKAVEEGLRLSGLVSPVTRRVEA